LHTCKNILLKLFSGHLRAAPILVLAYEEHDRKIDLDDSQLFAVDPLRHRFIRDLSRTDNAYSVQLPGFHTNFHSKLNSLFGFHQLFRSSVELLDIYRREGHFFQNVHPHQFLIGVSPVSGPLNTSNELRSAAESYYYARDIVIASNPDALLTILNCDEPSEGRLIGSLSPLLFGIIEKLSDFR
jgi:hypothetical protein